MNANGSSASLLAGRGRGAASWVALLALAAGVPPSLSSQEGPYLYAAGQGAATVSIIDVGSLEVVETVDLRTLGFSDNAKPHHIVVEADGSAWYLSLIGENRVLKFDRDNALVGQVELEVPGMLAIHPSQDLLYVGRSMSAVNPPRRIGIVDRSDMSSDELDVLFPRPHALAVRPEGDFAYSASLAANQMAAIETATDGVTLAELEGDTHTLVQFAISPDGRTMVATGQLTGLLLIFDLADPASPRLVDTIEVGAHPWHPVFTPDGRHVYFGNKLANTVTVIDVEARRVAEVVEGYGISEPHGSAVSPDGRYAFVASNNLGGAYASDDGSTPGTVTVIDTSTHEIVTVIEVGENATGLGIRPPS
jgi:YVTN family beta-propeller protein